MTIKDQQGDGLGNGGLNPEGHPWENQQGVTLTKGQLVSMIFEAAGAGSVPFMEDHPDYVMPSERMTVGIVEVIHAASERLGLGIDVSKLEGYAGAIETAREFDEAARIAKEEADAAEGIAPEHVATPEAQQP